MSYLDPVEQLTDLFNVVFRSDDEIQRFLVLAGISLAEPDQVRSAKRGRAAAARSTAEALVRGGLVDTFLFDALARRSPEHRGDIDAVAASVLGTDPGSEPLAAASAGIGEDLSPEHASLLAEFVAELSAMPPQTPVALGTEPSRWPWAAAGSVLGRFDPLRLRPLPTAAAPPSTALAALSTVVATTHDGSWMLHDDVRHACLSRLAAEGLVEDAVRANLGTPDARRDLLRRILDGEEPELAGMERTDLVDLEAVLGWLETLGHPAPIARSAVRTASERRLLVDPLRSLVGKHFAGRERELAVLQVHLRARGGATALLIRGPGGAGKSTLVGRAVLDLEERALRGSPVSFVYLDFDKAHLDVRDPAGLVREMAHQLRLLHGMSDRFAEQFAAVEAVSAGTDLPLAADILDLGDSPDPDELVEALGTRLLWIRAQFGAADEAPLVLFLDTVEEVARHGPGAVHALTQVLDRMHRAIPGMRLIACGRSVEMLHDVVPDATVMELTELDATAADALLIHRGVTDPQTRSLIVDRFGANPLTLRLAAEALLRLGAAEPAFGDLVGQSGRLAAVAREQVQGMLYSRILGHIDDPEVVRVAHPGLAVRRITVPVLRDVLAVPCRLDPERSELIFERLRAEVSMFELEAPGVLRHRDDVRRLMLRTMLDEPDRASTVMEIHRRAADFYAGQGTGLARAEEVYHRLMADEDPRSLDHLWHESLRRDLESALDEPLPPRARRWLSRRVSLSAAGTDSWEQEDWEANAAARAASWLTSGQYERALAVLAERPERLPDSRLYAIEAAAHLGLGDLDAADRTVQAGMWNLVGAGDRHTQLQLARQGLEVQVHRDDGDGVLRAATSCLALSDLQGDVVAALETLNRALPVLRALGHPGTTTLEHELARRFSHVSGNALADSAPLVRQVLHVAGLTDSTVLHHAAAAGGDRTDEAGAIFQANPYAVARLLDGLTPEAGDALAGLATEVGLPREGWKPDELASLLVRTGRTGHAVQVGLDYAVDEQAARNLVVNELVRPDTGPWTGDLR